MEKENLPDFLGGTCTMFGQHKDGVGPWNDYEIVNPVGIRKKQEGASHVPEGLPTATDLVINTASSSKEESKHHEWELVAVWYNFAYFTYRVIYY